MALADEQPWFHHALQLLDLRRQDRVLALHCEPEQTRSLGALVGSRGEVTIVQPDHGIAEAIVALSLPQVEVLAHTVLGDETFGSFDAMLIVPPVGPLLPSGAYAELARSNLRPGGRFVIDVPGLNLQPDLTAAWASLGWAPLRLQPLHGYDDDDLARVLRNAGLRRVEGVLGSHLLHFAAPADLVFAFAAALQLTEAERLELTHEVLRRRGSAGPLDALVHRTRLQALR